MPYGFRTCARERSFRIDLDGKVTIVADVPSRPFGLGFLPDGGLLIALMTQRLILKFGPETSAVFADMADVAVGNLRDMTVARDGNTYVTSIDADAAGPDCFASARSFWRRPTARSVQLPTTWRIRTDWRSQARMICWWQKRSAIV